MATVTESFDSAEKRDARWQELRRKYQHVIRYSDAVELGPGKWATVFFVNYPVVHMPEGIRE